MSNTLKFGNGQWATKEGSTLAYNDENNNFKPLPFNFERASSATVVNKDGLIETVGSGEPRIDYKDSSDGALLLEPQSTNLITYSEDFSQSSWVKINSTVSSNQAISPDGTNNSTLYTSTNSSNRLEINFSSPSTIRTFSIYIKSFNNNHVEGRVTFSGLNDFNFTSTNEWQRISTTRDVSGDAFKCSLRLTNSNDSILVFGAMLEEVSYPTSYIKTTSAAVTRLADECNNGANEQVINSSEGVLYAEISGLANPASQEVALSVSEGQSGANRLLIRMKTNGEIGIVLRVSDTTEASINGGVFNQLSNHKVAVKWKVNDIALWIDGVEVGTDSSANVFSANTLNEVSFNQGNNSNQFYGNCKDLRVYNTALTDSELAALTR